ncbi:hypothetical protein [Actinomycetospora soli]|uniref:hypothetical protein n=1 Tax=Actinomycetospora soli TaxID=2893887 RepID=UPI001E428545|nr:hypothetical protein [Actinomycetospora soli]MCD2189210.1 hypothetical protein [Actinomycetospora soli]
MSTMPTDVAEPGGSVDDELRWAFYRTAMAAWVEAAGRAPVPSPRTSPEDTLRRVPR